jgi:hypothetical protein
VKHRYSVEVDVDVAGWCNTYGCVPEDVPGDVEAWIEGQLDNPTGEGIIGDSKATGKNARVMQRLAAMS